MVETTSPELVRELITKGSRLEGRSPLEYRKIEIKANRLKKAEGSCELSLGDTKVIAGVKFDTMTPYPDSPDKGGLMVNISYIPIVFKELSQNKDIEASRVVDRSIRESKALALEDFCITPGEKAFTIFIDAYILNYDGNLIDAINLAALKALMSAKMPVLDEKGKAAQSDKPLKLNSVPIMVTVSSIDGEFIADLSSAEEHALDYSLCLSYLEDGRICAMQKQGSMGIPREDLEKIFEIGAKKQAELRKALEQ
jgi:exosome complex component RRP42